MEKRRGGWRKERERREGKGEYSGYGSKRREKREAKRRGRQEDGRGRRNGKEGRREGTWAVETLNLHTKHAQVQLRTADGGILPDALRFAGTSLLGESFRLVCNNGHLA